jgi:hypothetical protein
MKAKSVIDFLSRSCLRHFQEKWFRVLGIDVAFESSQL